MGRIWNVKQTVSTAVLFFFLLALGACGQNAIAPAMDATTQAFADDSRAIALEWLDAAKDSESALTSAYAYDLEEILADREISYAPYVYADECIVEDGFYVAAFVLYRDTESAIYVCELSTQQSPEFMAQVLIHEAIHLSGISDECTTTGLELDLMEAAGQQAHQNAYVSACGLNAR